MESKSCGQTKPKIHNYSRSHFILLCRHKQQAAAGCLTQSLLNILSFTKSVDCLFEEFVLNLASVFWDKQVKCLDLAPLVVPSTFLYKLLNGTHSPTALTLNADTPSTDRAISASSLDINDSGIIHQLPLLKSCVLNRTARPFQGFQ